MVVRSTAIEHKNNSENQQSSTCNPHYPISNQQAMNSKQMMKEKRSILFRISKKITTSLPAAATLSCYVNSILKISFSFSASLTQKYPTSSSPPSQSLLPSFLAFQVS